MVSTSQPQLILRTKTELEVESERRPLRLLLAEDNAINQLVGLRPLERLGYRADVVNYGRKALEDVRRQPSDVVLQDVQMPELDGLEVARQTRAEFPFASSPGAPGPYIIPMTANAQAR